MCWSGSEEAVTMLGDLPVTVQKPVGAKGQEGEGRLKHQKTKQKLAVQRVPGR